MKLQEIMSMFQDDSKVDRTQLEVESMNTPLLHAKYLNMLHTEVAILKALISKQKVIELIKFQYYTGKADAQDYKDSPFHHKVMKSDLATYVEADTEYRTLDDKIEMKTNKVKYLESCVKGVANRNWAIRNAIEMIKFNNGM